MSHLSTHGDELWVYDSLHYRERSLCKKTDTEPNNDTVVIHSRYRCLGIDGIYERAASKAEATAERVLGHVVAVGRENSAVSNDSEDHERDEGEETHGSFEGVVAG